MNENQTAVLERWIYLMPERYCHVVMFGGRREGQMRLPTLILPAGWPGGAATEPRGGRSYE